MTTDYPLPSYDNFVRALTPWFESVQFPPTLYQQLYQKLSGSILDIHDSFSLTRIVVQDEGDGDADDASNEENEWESVHGDDPDEDDEEGSGAAAAAARQSAATGAADAGAATAEAVDEGTQRPGHLLLAVRDIPPCEDVWLIDHAITFADPAELAAQLVQNPSLCDRMEDLLRLTPLPTPEATTTADAPGAPEELDDAAAAAARAQQQERRVQGERVKRILSVMWRSLGSYSLGRADGEAPLVRWFLPDEVGSAVLPFTPGDQDGSDTPMVRMEVMPLLLPPAGVVFSVMWCPAEVRENQIVGRAAAYAPNWAIDGQDRHALVDDPTSARILLEVVYGEPSSRLCDDAVQVAVVSFQRAQAAIGPDTLVGPVFAEPSHPTATAATASGALKVYSDSTAITTALRTRAADSFEVVSTPSAADVVWISHSSGLTRFAGGPGSTKKAFPGAKYLSSFPNLDAILATPATWIAWMRDHIDPTTRTVSALPVVYKGTASDLCIMAGEFLVREIFNLLGATQQQQRVANQHDVTPIVKCASQYTTFTDVETLRCADGVNGWYAYALPTAMAAAAGGAADHHPLVESSDLTALLKLAEPRPMVYLKHQYNSLRLLDFPARAVTVKVFLAVRAVASADTVPDVRVYNDCVVVLKPDAIAAAQMPEDAEQVSQTLADLTTPYVFVGASGGGAAPPVKQSLWLQSSELVPRVRALFPFFPSAWDTAQQEMLHVLRTVVPLMVTDDVTRDPAEALTAADLQRRRSILCATFVLGRNAENTGIQPMLVNIRDGADYASLNQVCPAAISALFRAVILNDQTDTIPL